MTWTVARESGSVACSGWLADEAGAISHERQALVQAFRAHPPVSLKLTFREHADPFETAVPGVAGAPGPSRAVYSDLLDRLPMMIQMIEADGLVEHASRATLRLLGHAPEDIVGRRALSLFTEDSRRHMVETVLPQFFAAGEIANVPVQLVTSSGDATDLWLSAVGARNGVGRIEHVVAAFAER